MSFLALRFKQSIDWESIFLIVSPKVLSEDIKRLVETFVFLPKKI